MQTIFFLAGIENGQTVRMPMGGGEIFITFKVHWLEEEFKIFVMCIYYTKRIETICTPHGINII